MKKQMQLKTQSGAALFVALVILLLVTLIGVSAIRGGLFHEIMAFNAQADEMTFQASETAINGVIRLSEVDTRFVSDIYKQSLKMDLNHEHDEKETWETCVTNLAVNEFDGVCSDSETLDSRSSIKSDASSKFEFKVPAIGSDPDAIMDYQFSTVGKGHFKQASLPFKNQNYQAWRKPGLGTGNFSDNKNLLDLSE